jgi:hypothetical protein
MRNQDAPVLAAITAAGYGTTAGDLLGQHSLLGWQYQYNAVRRLYRQGAVQRRQDATGMWIYYTPVGHTAWQAATNAATVAGVLGHYQRYHNGQAQPASCGVCAGLAVVCWQYGLVGA